MTDATKLIAGILLITVPTIEYGGTFLLGLLSRSHAEFTDFQRPCSAPDMHTRACW